MSNSFINQLADFTAIAFNTTLAYLSAVLLVLNLLNRLLPTHTEGAVGFTAPRRRWAMPSWIRKIPFGFIAAACLVVASFNAWQSERLEVQRAKGETIEVQRRLDELFGAKARQREKVRTELGKFISKGRTLRDRAFIEGDKVKAQCQAWSSKVAAYLRNNFESSVEERFKGWNMPNEGLYDSMKLQIGFLYKLIEENEGSTSFAAKP